ncbi:E3 ubiquitin-protein ligase PPP1R11-like [Pollicipes pollicipes]|uniref:E3 ubiquitin-protein ligase PPP1R11-like n=1 Tax=Pollicipes pollicipes TaxID=41117 RepID=UPI001885665A|nr:E3 ubiquitin-protein ligase PPP1R11-like [Pollicipes pollicipes]XP_037094754.1 E3 ubiquitin-protein ligase PPP1R11-like [Pollicipes pollicipes]XP_037094832.1 E3 ubiquitin-protein ligase PPP1R11-like [Pollicipes pollicipes]
MSEQATAEPPSQTQTVTAPAEPPADTEPTLHLRLVRPHNPRRVCWQSDTVDNEHMGKKKSKCCCVYRKPKPFGESSSDEEDECKNCVGHRKPKSPAEGGEQAGGAPGPAANSGSG